MRNGSRVSKAINLFRLKRILKTLAESLLLFTSRSVIYPLFCKTLDGYHLLYCRNRNKKQWQIKCKKRRKVRPLVQSYQQSDIIYLQKALALGPCIPSDATAPHKRTAFHLGSALHFHPNQCIWTYKGGKRLKFLFKRWGRKKKIAHSQILKFNNYFKIDNTGW